MITQEEMVYKGKYMNYTFFLACNDQVGCTNGYVKIKPCQKGYKCSKDYVETEIQCHGGITFDEYDKHHNRIIGFDTAHYSDAFKWNPLATDEDPYVHIHHWTQSELIDQCKLIINQLATRKSVLPF